MGNETKIFSFPEAGGFGGGNGLAAMLPALLQNRGIDTAALMGMMSNGNGGFFGNNGGFQDIIALIVIAAIFGNGNFGFGGNGNGRGDTERQMLMDAIQRNGVDIAQLASAVGCSKDQILAGINGVSNAICGLGNQMGQNTNQIITALMQGNNALASQLCECCCSMKGLVTEQGYQGQLRTIQQTQDIVQNATSNANVIAAKIDAQTQIINDKFCQLEMREMQNKLDAERAKSAALAGQLSQEHQTATIQASQMQAIAPVNAVLADLSARLAKIECNQPEVAKIPFVPAAGNYIPVNYGINVNPLATQCGC